MVCPRCPSTASTTAHPLAGEAGDDDVEEGDDAVYDGHDGGSDGADDGHDRIADRLEDGFHARYYGTHDDGSCSGLEDGVCGSWSSSRRRCLWRTLFAERWEIAEDLDRKSVV